MLRIDRIGFNRNFFGSQAGSPEAHGQTGLQQQHEASSGFLETR
jgi:hypothetical protein